MRLLKHRTEKEPKVKSVGFTTAWFYKTDIAFIKERGIPMSVALRDGLFEYVLTIKAKERGQPAWHTMTKAERDAQILSAKDEIARLAPSRLDAATSGPAENVPEIRHELAPDMRSMTPDEQAAWLRSGEKADMDTWILLGKDGCTIRPGGAIAAALGPAAAEPEIPRGHVPDMSTWTKAERDAWILAGAVPNRVMRAAKTTGARAF